MGEHFCDVQPSKFLEKLHKLITASQCKMRSNGTDVIDRKKETFYVKLTVPLPQLQMFKCLESDADADGGGNGCTANF